MCGISSGQPACRDRFDIAFDAGYLPCKEKMRNSASGERCMQYLWRVDERITVYLAKLKELGIFEARYQFQNAFLFAVTQVVLK